jgi:hypothetical protein
MIYPVDSARAKNHLKLSRPPAAAGTKNEEVGRIPFNVVLEEKSTQLFSDLRY